MDFKKAIAAACDKKNADIVAGETVVRVEITEISEPKEFNNRKICTIKFVDEEGNVDKKTVLAAAAEKLHCGRAYLNFVQFTDKAKFGASGSIKFSNIKS